MTDYKYLSAYTAPGTDSPAFISLRQTAQGDIEVIAREGGQGAPIVQMEIPLGVFRDMMKEIAKTI